MAEPRSSSLLIYGGTAPAIVAAVRAAREGLDVVLVTPTRHLGAAFPSLGALETHYRGVRAPLLREFAERVKSHYRATYGADSPQWRACADGRMLTFEPQVAERILREWIEAEPRITWLPDYLPLRAERDGRKLRQVEFRRSDGATVACRAEALVEASDEGDLMAAADVQFRVGRESRHDYDEPRAGKVFTRWCNGTHPQAAAEGRLNLVTANATTSDPLPGSTGAGDDNIQSYSYRLCLTDDPANRRMLASPPSGYDRAAFAPILLPPAEKERLPLPFHHRFLIHSLRDMVERDHLFHGHTLPNRKRSWNATNLTGAAKGYPCATPEERDALARRHRDHALGLLWFLQNDPGMPADLQAMARAWGLARDEFVATDNLPPHLYVREARRLAGRAVFTERDALAASPQGRAPVHRDAIAITEFSLDSLACTTERLPGAGALCDGQLFQMEVSRPGQVPFGALLPRDVDNLLVVTTLSATHVGWGTVRQTPTQMHLAESAAWAIVLARRAGIAPAALDVDSLQRQLVTSGVMITFFNEFDMAATAPWLPAVQYFGAKGFFDSYDARPEAECDHATLERWAGSGSPNGARPTRAELCQWLFERVAAAQ